MVAALMGLMGGPRGSGKASYRQGSRGQHGLGRPDQEADAHPLLRPILGASRCRGLKFLIGQVSQLTVTLSPAASVCMAPLDFLLLDSNTASPEAATAIGGTQPQRYLQRAWL